MKKAIVIIRESTTYQEIESQKTEILNYALKFYSEDQIEIIGKAGASAIKLDDHYKEIMNSVESLIGGGGIECVFAWALDRIGRDELQLHTFKKVLTDARVQLRILNPNFSLLREDGSVDPFAELAFSMFSTMAKQEMEQKKSRFGRSKKRNSENMKFNGGWCTKFGYKVDPEGNVVPDKENSDFVVSLFQEFATGKYSINSLTKELRERGITRPDGKVITSTFLRDRLKDTAYLGYTDKKNSHRKYIPLEGVKENWDKVQEVLEKNNISILKAPARHYAALKILKCKECGYNYTINGGIYRCWLHYNKYVIEDPDKTCSCNHCINADWMDSLLWDTAFSYEVQFSEVLKKQNLELLKEERRVILQKLGEAKKKLGDLENKRGRIVEAYIEGDISKKEKDSKVEGLKIKEGELKNTVAQFMEIAEQKEKLISLMMDGDKLGKTQNYQELYFRAPNKEKYDIIHRHIKEAYIEPFKGKTRVSVVMYSGDQKEFLYDPKTRILENRIKDLLTGDPVFTLEHWKRGLATVELQMKVALLCTLGVEEKGN